MSVAAETRAAVRNRPFLLEALRAGVLNYAAAARALDVSADTDAVAAALRRFGESLEDRSPASREATVTMRSGLASVEPDSALLAVGDSGFGPTEEGGEYTGILARGGVDAATLEHALGVCRAHDVEVEAAGVLDGALVVIVARRDGPDALRRLEAALEGAPG